MALNALFLMGTVIHIQVYVDVFEVWAIYVSCLQISKRDGQPELSQDFSINLFK